MRCAGVLLVRLCGVALHHAVCITQRLSFLPPHSPELNPLEHLWDGLRKKYFRKRVFDSIDALEDHPVVALRDLETPPSAAKSFDIAT
ncbi:hypothetical protein D5045_18660 [Verminephrobacter eiseniae]|nr:hypothetical protein [Verminephrobacter eiseniae]